MKKSTLIQYFVFVFLFLGLQQCTAQKPENWTADQLMAPAALAKTLELKKDIPIIYSVGPGAIIPHSIDIGMTNDEKNLDRFKKAVSNLPRTANIVIYCGCCPFEHCPNVRPAIDVLKAMNFTNFHLLNLPKNIKTDWISKGYPVVAD